jgi:hypothetical protein
MATSVSSPLDAFVEALADASLRNKQRANQLLGSPVVLRDTVDKLSVITREETRQRALTELQEAVAIAMGGSAPGNTMFQSRPGQRPPQASQSAQPGSHLIMRAIEKQGNFIASRHRAEVLRYGTFVRRIVHTATRRNAHSDPGGLFERRTETPVVDTLKRASS